MFVLPFFLVQYVGSVALLEPEAVASQPLFAVMDAILPLFELPFIFVSLSIHAKLRARHRISAD